MPVELIGPVDAPGGNGPTNGMYALQKALRKRIDEGLDWLSIKPLPVSKGAMPWFWNWQDRRYAVWWGKGGMSYGAQIGNACDVRFNTVQLGDAERFQLSTEVGRLRQQSP